MKIALVQMNSGPDKDRNIARAILFVRRAIQKKAEFILLPEVFHFRGALDKEAALQHVAESIPGKTTCCFQEIARKDKVFILLGSIYELPFKGAKKIYNTSVLIDNQGRISTTYRKRKLFKVRLPQKHIDESKILSAGHNFVTANVKGWRVGLSICYDLRFSEIYRTYARGGAQIICVPSSFTFPTGKAHFEILLRARAIENLCYIVAPNQVGSSSNGIAAYGNSMVIDPWGKILARAGARKEGIIFANLDRGNIVAKRKSLPGILK